VTALTGTPWRYLKIGRKDFEKIKAQSLGD